MYHCQDCKEWFETPKEITHLEAYEGEAMWEEELVDNYECPRCGSNKISYHEIP
jgi:rubredoxin